MLRNNTIEKLVGALLGAIVGATALTILGVMIPFLHTKYVDNSQYYYIDPNPLTVENSEVKQCEILRYKGTRYSRLDFNGQMSTNLIRVQTGSLHNVQVLSTIPQTLNVEKGIVDLELSYPIPCDLTEGQYFLSGVVPYRVNGVEKSYRWTSEVFLVQSK